MTSATFTTRLSRLPGFRRRRVRIWAALVSLIVVALLIQAAFPGVRFLPAVAGDLGPLAILSIFLVALFCEYIDSSLGMGYGTTLTPLLLLVGFDPLQIVPCVLLSEFVTGLAAGLLHHRDGNVDLVRDRRARGTVLLLSALSVFGAVAAVTLALTIPAFWLKLIIAVIIFSIGVVILSTIHRRLRYRRGHIIAVGAVAAFNKGLSGGGYGPLVTAGQVVSGLPAKHAVAITSLAESLTCIVGLIAYLMLHSRLDLTLAAPLTLGALLSVPMATLTVRRIPENAMRAAVGTVTCLLGAFALLKLLF
ncbi:MAG: sulfite exporter TauE/SafE family protein [Planctomycetota bacterium]|nr:sulfite exporter TauE/SafE family protein [Planctomycetota bacterium]